MAACPLHFAVPGPAGVSGGARSLSGCWGR